MSQEAAFWDASAVVPLCLKEPTTPHAEGLFLRYQQAVWWTTIVEVRSAIARSIRAGDCTDSAQAAVVGRLTNLSISWQVVPPDILVREHAQALLDRYPLRAADSLQLAAALFWCARNPRNKVFLSGDARLCNAATGEGFRVIVLQPGKQGN